MAVEEREAGRQMWEWTLHGEAPPADLMLDAIGPVQRARRDLVASLLPGSN